MFTTADRDAVLGRAVQLLSEDDRVEAAVLTGSLGRGTADRWSDIDLDAVITAGTETATVAAAWEQLVYREWPVAHHYATEFGSTPSAAFSSAMRCSSTWHSRPSRSSPRGPRCASCSIERADHGDRLGWKEWSPTPDAGVEAGFAGHDVLHACVAANRDRRWQSLYYLQRVRNRTLALASERHGWDSDDFTRVDDLPTDEIGALEDSLVATLDRNALLRAVDVTTGAFLTELGRHDRALADRLAEPLLDLIATSRQG